nr:hypothetical protein [uncultured Brumimicrobium sp.]
MNIKKATLSVLTLLIISSLILVSCNKEEPVKLPSNYIAGSSCTNDVLDANEEGVDCGGVCDPCFPTSPGCSFYSNNQIAGANSNIVFTNNKTFVFNGNFVFLATNNQNDTMRFVFLNQTPEFFKAYYPSTFNSIDHNKVFVEARLNSLPYPINYDTYYDYKSENYTGPADYNERLVHLNKENGKVQISFCELKLLEQSQSGMIEFKGKLIEN